MRDLFGAAWCRVSVTLGLLAAGLLMPVYALAQDAPGLWTSTCSVGCHLTPPNLSGDIPFGDATLFANLDAFKVRVGKTTSNSTMRTFAGTAPGSSSTYTDAQRQTILNYLANVRNANVTSTVDTFPPTNVNQTNATTRQVTITNYRGEALNFTPLLSNSTDFSMTNNCAEGPAVGAQSSCSITISFRPVQGITETRAGNLTITFGEATAFTPTTRTIELSGSVNPPVYRFDANAGPFSARVNVGADLNVGTLRNTGSATLALTNLTPISGSGAFALSPADPAARPGACTSTQQLGANGSCPLWVRFSPTAQSSATARFQLTHNAAGSPSTVDVTAVGTQPLVSPITATLDFGDVQLGTPKSLAVQLSNTGNMPLTFTADPKLPAALSGANSADYSATTSCPSAVGQTLANGAPPCTITVTFTPPLVAAEGVSRTARLTVRTDADNNGGLLIVDLTGKPVALPPPTVTSPSTDFPETVIEDASAETRQIIVASSRTSSLVYSISDSDDFKVKKHEDCPTREVPGGGSCTVTMEFRPVLGTGEGRRSVSIPVSFTGTGNPSPINAVLAGRALLPLQVSPNPATPTAVVGSSGTSSILLTNRRSSAFTFTSATFSGPASGDYSLDPSNGCTAGLLLNSGSNCTLVLRFTPPQDGARNATMTLVHTAAGSPQTMAIQGTATPRPQGRLSFCSDCLNFADTQIGSGSTSSIALQNTGTLAINFSGFSVVGANPGDFTRGGTCAVGASLAIGAQCTIDITFRPSALGARSGQLRVDSDATDATVLIELTGTGVPVPVPVLTLTPGVVTFGEQTVGGIYPSRLLRLSNTGTADLAVAAITVTGQGFSAVGAACLTTLKPGSGCDVELRFAPAAAATDYTGTVSVQSNASNSLQLASLTGRGIASAAPALTWEPAKAELPFGNIATGSISAVQSLTLRNNGPGGARLTVINAVGAGAEDFSVSGGTCRAETILVEGSRCTVDVSFAPGSSGARSAVLQAAASGSVAPAVTLTGTGLGRAAGVLSLSATALVFNDTRAGTQSLPAEVMFSNVGSGSLRVTGVSITGPYTMQSKTCPNAPFSLPAGSECVMSVTFMPPTEGDAAGALSVTTDADETAREVALSGHADPKADLSSGGCSMVDGDSPLDPTLWTLLLLAIAALAYRRRAYVKDRHAGARRRNGS